MRPLILRRALYSAPAVRLKQPSHRDAHTDAKRPLVQSAAAAAVADEDEGAGAGDGAGDGDGAQAYLGAVEGALAANVRLLREVGPPFRALC